MSTPTYVRTEMLPPKDPPMAASGPVKWMRENLFSSITNSILTILAIYFLFSLLASILPWMFHSSWTSNSLSECRDAIRATYGEGTTGACWAVIRERYAQLLFGFYPSELYWRPILAFVLMLVAIAPVLFANLPRQMLAFTAIFPFVVFFLLWGGTIWVPLAAMAGFVLGYFCLTMLPRYTGTLGATIAAILVPILWWLLLAGPVVSELNRISAGFLHDGYIARQEQVVSGLEAKLTDTALSADEVKALESDRDAAKRMLDEANGVEDQVKLIAGLKSDMAAAIAAGDQDKAAEIRNSYDGAVSALNADYAEIGRIGLHPVESAKFGGFMLSVTIGITGIALSLPLGILLALGRQSNLFVVRSLCIGFIEFIRGVPLITLLFVASTLLNYFLPPGTVFDLILRVMIMVTVFASAYMAEVIRGGLAALPKGQYEAADALGLDYWKSMRLIIMPQALKIAIPSIVSNFIGLFKDTTLVSIIGLLDPIGLSNSIRADQAWNGIVWELYGFIALMFWIFCFSMSRYSMYLERKLQTGHR